MHPHRHGIVHHVVLSTLENTAPTRAVFLGVTSVAEGHAFGLVMGRAFKGNCRRRKARKAEPTMPELPEVETTVRGLASVLDGQTITRLTLRPDLRRPFPPDLAQAMIGARVTGLSRLAKYGLIHTEPGRTMVFHLGMSGR
jgi:hypothetical protein